MIITPKLSENGTHGGSIDEASEKWDLTTNCVVWQTYVSRPSWKPTKTDSPKLGAYRDFVPSPRVTDPDTCRNAFLIYVGSLGIKAGSPILRLLPGVQTNVTILYTCSIGSFNVYTTVEAIDCSAKTATMNFWMYNEMSRNSFGKFASHPAFALSGVKTQYMWWNWVETVDWSSGNNDNRSEDHFGTLVVMRNAAMKLLGVFLGLAWLAVIFPNLAAGQAVIASDRTVLDLGSVQVDDMLSQILDRLWRRLGAFWRFPLPRTAAARDMSRCLAAPIGEFQKLCLMSSFRS